MSAAVLAYCLIVAALIVGCITILLAAGADRYIDEPDDDIDDDLAARRLDEWFTAVDRIKQDRGNR